MAVSRNCCTFAPTKTNWDMEDTRFNGCVCDDGRIRFRGASAWKCTDPDEYQYCRKVSDTTFEYIQLKENGVKQRLSLSGITGTNALYCLGGDTKPEDWHFDTIDVSKMSDKDIIDAVSPYGRILEGVEDKEEVNQLIAECAFEEMVREEVQEADK